MATLLVYPVLMAELSGASAQAFDVGLRLIGAFYVFGAVMLTRAAQFDRFVSQSLAILAANQVDVRDRQQSLWFIGSAFVMGAGGVALVVLLDWALPLFVLCLAGQIFYLTFLAPRYFDLADDADDEPDMAGRASTIRAAWVYALATVIVCVAGTLGVLRSIGSVWLIASSAFALFLVVMLLTLRQFRFVQGEASATQLDQMALDPLPKVPAPAHLRLSPTWRGLPLFDADTHERASPDVWETELSDVLIDDVEAWNQRFACGELIEAAAGVMFKDPRELADWEADGLALRERLASALPNSVVTFVPTPQPIGPLLEPSHIKVMVDTYSHALWQLYADFTENLAPEQIGVTGLIVRDLDQWASDYTEHCDAKTNSEDEDGGQWSDQDKAEEFHRGFAFAERLANELHALGKGHIKISVYRPDFGPIELADARSLITAENAPEGTPSQTGR